VPTLGPLELLALAILFSLIVWAVVGVTHRRGRKSD
jgi:hypothetical protein